MPTTVEIAFNLALAGQGNFFTLNDSAKGVLGGTVYKLAGDVLVDVTSTVREVSVRRGRSRTLERFTAGVAQMTLDNRSRRYDPTYTSGPYYGSITPRKQVRITRDGYSIFRGNVESWSWNYDLAGDATAEVRCVDGFAAISQAAMTAGTAVGTTPGARIGSALDNAGWPTTQRALATGDATLDQDIIGDEVNVLQYVQKVEKSEPGAFFMSKEGYATFLSRGDLQNPASGNVTFGTAGVPFIDYKAASLTDEMTNTVAVTYTAGSVIAGTATASDATSVQSYGQFDATIDTLLSGNLQAQRLADWRVSNYKDPKYRVDSVTVVMEGLTSAQQLQVLDLELGDVVTVQVAVPNVSPIGTAISQVLVIDQIEHNIGIDRHYVTFTMSETTTAFILDSSSFGVLNTNKLGF